MPRDDLMPVRLLEQARGGDAAALGRLLELYRNYLRLVARSLIGTAAAAAARPLRPGPGDVPRGPPRLPGSPARGEPELVAWLRRILVDNLADQVRAPPPPGARPPAAGVARGDARPLGR